MLRMTNISKKRTFMHYHPRESSMIDSDRARKEFEIFFWEADEAYDRKSLPWREDDRLLRKTFTIQNTPPEYALMGGEVHPWFGKPGGGTKYFFEKDGEQMSIAHMVSIGVIAYLPSDS